MRSKQAPIPSGFGAKTTARVALGDVDLFGKTAIVTGGYSGLGMETARVLTEAGATVIVPARSPHKAREALRSFARIEMETIDLMDPSSIDSFAARFLETGRPLHLLVHSAGIMATQLQRDARGYEAQLTTNHLGHFHLTARLWSALRKAGGARVVSVSSRAHRIAGVDFSDPNFERREYQKWPAYGQSKSANVLFAVGLDLRGEPHGVRAFAVHPGTVLTDLARHLSQAELRELGALDDQGRVRTDEGSGLKTVEQGAATSVWCATSPQLRGMGGVYCEDCDVAEATSADEPRPSGVRPWAVDPELAEKLWTLSEGTQSRKTRRRRPLSPRAFRD